MKISVDPQNAGKIVQALAKVNGDAFQHTVSAYSKVEEIAREADKIFEKSGLTFKLRAGAQITFRPAGALAKAYNNPYITTQITLMVGSNGKTFYLVDVERTKAWPRQNRLFDIALTESSHNEYVQMRSGDFSVRKPDEQAKAA